MAIVKLKNKFQLTVPNSLRKQAGFEVGDIFDAKFEQGKLTFSPKSIIDQRLAKSLESVRMGKVSPVFENVEDMITYLKKRTKKHR